MIKEEAKYLLPIMQAFVEGKVIECRAKLNRIKGAVDIPNKWTETNEIWCVNSLEYRIKPEQEPKYRPFANAEECWQEMQKHQPFGWVTCQCAFFHIIYIEDKLIGYGSACGTILHSKFNDVLKSFTFADGLPFGVEEEK